MHSKIDDAYEEIEYNVEMTVKNRQSFAENDADNMDVFMRIDRVRRLVMALRGASFCQIMNGCSAVRSPIQRTNLIMKDPNYRKCYQLWQFMERYDKVGYNIDVQQQSLAFDDEYMVQMYTNLINNYAVFKSLTDDERNLQELESVHPEPVAPKFIKEIKEVQVDSPDLPDVEIRRVFVEEVTQAQLDAEQALAEAREQIEELQGQVKSWKVQAHALTDERDDLADELDEAKTRELALTQRAQMAEADVEELQGSLEDVEAGKKAAEDAAAAELAAVREASAKELAELHAKLDAAKLQIEEVQLTAERDARAAQEAADAAAAAADQKLADTVADAEARVAAAQQAADAAIDAARTAADSAVEQAAVDANGKVAAAVAERDAATRAAEEARADADARIAAAEVEAGERVEQEVAAAKATCEHEVEAARAEMEQRLASLTHELELAVRDRERAERRAEGNSLSRYLLARLRGDADELAASEDDAPATDATDAEPSAKDADK